MNKLLLSTLLLNAALSIPVVAAENGADQPQQSVEDEKVSRRKVLEQQKEAVDQLNLPPAQKPSEPPVLLDLPVDRNDSPGAVKK